jgi:hypothetical protein
MISALLPTGNIGRVDDSIIELDDDELPPLVD